MAKAKRKKLLVLLIVLIVIGGVILFLGDYIALYYRIYRLNKWLDQKIEGWGPRTYRSMMFNGHHILASENLVLITPKNTTILFLEMLLELGVDTVSFNIYPQNFETKKDIYDCLINKTREKGGKTIIVCMVDSNTFSKSPTFEEYLSKEIEYTKILVERYKPGYYGILVEPSTMQKRIGANFTINQWLELINTTHKLIKSINPETKTFISLLLSEAKGAIE